MTDTNDFILGIDGGGTSTKCILADATGRTLAHTQAPPSNYRKTDLREAREAIACGIRMVLEMVGVKTTETTGTPRFAAVCAGLAGVDTKNDAAVFRQMLAEIVSTDHLQVVNDGEIALYGALEGEPGLLVISGTGSIVWATARDGYRLRVGGWDYILSDEGSGYSIGLRVLRAVASAHDRCISPTCLTAELFRFFNIEDFDQLLDIIYHEEMTPQRIASLAPLAERAATEGDTAALRVIEDAAKELALLADSAARQAGLSGEEFPVVPMGGALLAGGRLAQSFRELLNSAAPSAYFVEPRHTAAEGAVRLALHGLARGVHVS